jgi:bifunctional DNase/RNase
MPRGKWRKSDVKPEKLVIMLLGVALAISVASLLYFSSGIPQPRHVINPDDLAALGISTEGFIEVEPSASVINGTGVVSLRSGCMEIVANTEAHQAESISNGLQSAVDVRPNSHDVMRDIADSLGIQVIMVKVTEIRGTNYIGELILRQGDTILSLDSRPSDGIALAVRTGSPIYFDEVLFNDRATSFC